MCVYPKKSPKQYHSTVQITLIYKHNTNGFNLAVNVKQYSYMFHMFPLRTAFSERSGKYMRNAWKVLKFCDGEGWKSLGPIV